MARINRGKIRHLYSVEDARRIDRTAIEKGTDGIVLMKRAGRAALALLQETWPGARHLEVFCGAGNNAGDGYILAGLAADQGFDVCVWELTQPGRLGGDAALARDFALKTAAQLVSFDQYEPVETTQVLVDALLGTGFKGELRGCFASAIELINQRKLPVIAMDVPSGLDANTGHVAEAAVRADLTISFIVLKKGLLTGQAVDCVGELVLDDLEVDPKLVASVPAPVELIGVPDLGEVLKPRRKSAHKGDFGTLLVVGGDLGFGGAAIMAAEAALLSGAGRVVLATRAEHVAAALARCPEVMVHGVAGEADLAPLLEMATAMVVGPGLGTSSWSRQMLHVALQNDVPKVLDADALNLLASTPQFKKLLNSECLLTPHPGEAARMLNIKVADIQGDRFSAMQSLLENFPGTFVLKGAGTLVGAQGQVPGLCDRGNPGMAVAGMGDVLSGVCGAMLARGFTPAVAARASVFVHARAADMQAEARGEVGLRASDLLPSLRTLLNGRFTHD